MRKHRLAECLLVDVIGLPWEEVHPEACRWEHVMSEAVERRLLVLLGHPTTSPFGNPIPGLAELQAGELTPDEELGRALPGRSLAAAAGEEGPRVVEVLRIGEVLQADEALMAQLHRVGATPGSRVEVLRVGEQVRVGKSDDAVHLTSAQSAAVVVAG